MPDQNTLFAFLAGGWLLNKLANIFIDRINKDRPAEQNQKLSEIAASIKEMRKEIDEKVPKVDYLEKRTEFSEKLVEIKARLLRIESRITKFMTDIECTAVQKETKDILDKLKKAIIIHGHDTNGKTDLKEVIF